MFNHILIYTSICIRVTMPRFNYIQIQDYVKSLCKPEANNCELMSIGKSYENREMLVMKVNGSLKCYLEKL